MKTTGKVFIVGAGPGDPALITVKGVQCLQQADCVVYDFLSNQVLLEYCDEHCERICVGKADGIHLLEQEGINTLLYEKACEHHYIVRLKGGDPFVFSRGFEEAQFLAERSIDYEVVPGITSALAGPVSAGIPLTIKDRVTSVAIVTGRRKDPHAAIEAPNCKTVIYLMGVKNIANIVKALRGSGRDETTPCAFIECATHHDSRLIPGTIGTIEQIAGDQQVRPPAVLIVGEVSDYGCQQKKNI